MELAMVLGDGLTKKGKFWTDAWSLIEGCTPVSPGCAHCWLAGMYKRNLPNLQADVAGEYTTPTGEKVYRFHGNVICREDRLDQPLRAKKPRVYAIWSDLFHESVPLDFLNRAFDTMNKAKHHRFIIITKRPDHAADYLRSWPQWSPMPNVTILVTMEDQQRANERAPYALELAGMGWRSGALCEPLLGPVDLDRIYSHGETKGEGSWGSWDSCISGKRLDVWSDSEVDSPKLVWVITGGESGHGARPAHPDWFRSLRDQAQAAGVPFLFKQWGEWAFSCNHGSDNLECRGKRTIGVPTYVGYRVGKVAAGRSLDGREWLELIAT